MASKISTFKAIEIASSLSAVEFKQLLQFSSLFSRSSNPQLQAAIKFLYENRKGPPISREKVQKALGLNKSRCSDIMNKLLYILEDYGLVKSILENETRFDKRRHWFLFLVNRQLTDIDQAAFKNTAESLQDNTIYSPWEFLALYRYRKELSIYEKVVEGRKLSTKLSDYTENLDLFYCLEKLKMLCEKLNRIEVKSEIELAETVETVKALALRFAAKYPLVKIYLLLLDFLAFNSRVSLKDYDELFCLIRKLKSSVNCSTELQTIGHYILNISIVEGKRSDKLFHSRTLDVISFLEVRGLLLERGIIAPTIFKVAISIGLKLNRLVWVHAFMTKYVSHLPAGKRNEIENFCLALIAFHKKDYDAVQSLLTNIDRSSLDVYFEVNIRRLEIKNFIQLHFSPTKSFKSDKLLRAFEHQLRNFAIFSRGVNNRTKKKTTLRTGISERDRQANLAFCHYLRKIILRHSILGEMKLIKGGLLRDLSVPEREWLLQLI